MNLIILLNLNKIKNNKLKIKIQNLIIIKILLNNNKKLIIINYIKIY